MDIPILYEDDALWVVDKPAGVVVNRAETVGLPTIQDWAEKRIQRTKNKEQRTINSLEANAFWDRSGIVHRLDKETSGCLIIAKTSRSFVDLQYQFKLRQVMKEYLALVHGRVAGAGGTIRVPLARSRYNRQKFAVTPGGREAETEYRVISPLTTHNLPLCLLRLFPKTGRTHQIRVHLAYFGHPIVADDKYAGEDRAKADRQWCPRLFLHARAVKFNHPVTHRQIVVTSPLPADLQSVLDNL